MAEDKERVFFVFIDDETGGVIQVYKLMPEKSKTKLGADYEERTEKALHHRFDKYLPPFEINKIKCTNREIYSALSKMYWHGWDGEILELVQRICSGYLADEYELPWTHRNIIDKSSRKARIKEKLAELKNTNRDKQDEDSEDDPDEGFDNDEDNDEGED